MARFLGAFQPPADHAALSAAEKRAWAKQLADTLRERMGLPPTDAEGTAPEPQPE